NIVKLKKAGCYRVSFGVESGDQGVLDRAKKGITIDQIKSAFKLAKKTGMETLGFFVLGLPGETKETMEKTINLAKELDVDLPKASIATPLPGTEFFHEWQERRLLNSLTWSDYVFHTTKRVAQYPGITDEEMTKYYNLFYRRLYLRPGFIWKRVWRGIKTGDIFFDVYYFLKVFLKFKW
ncbi:MAG: radical SAM protein, partial [Patescibacteria group bacterium]